MNVQEIVTKTEAYVEELGLELIGYDSCVLAARVLVNRLAEVDAKPMSVHLLAKHDDHDVAIKLKPHMVVVIDNPSLMLDPTSGQVYDLLPADVASVVERPDGNACQFEMPIPDDLYVFPTSQDKWTFEYTLLRDDHFYLGAMDWEIGEEELELKLASIARSKAGAAKIKAKWKGGRA